MTTRVRVMFAAVMVLVAAACTGAPAQSASAAAARPCGSPMTGAMTASTSSYVMTVLAGPEEQMYSQAEVNSQHPTSGEVMLGGEMAMPSGSAPQMSMGASAAPQMSMGASAAPQMSMGASAASSSVRHLEVHICTQSGTVVSDANPSIQLLDSTTGMTLTVPVAVMEGVTMGPTDLHYGNSVSLTPGHSYTVNVKLNGEMATFAIPTP